MVASLIFRCDLLLYGYGSYVLHFLHMPRGNTVISDIIYGSCGAYVLDHLAADGTGLAVGQVTVVTIGQVNAHFLCSLHLELVHSLASLGDIQLVVVRVAHFRTLLFFLRKRHFPKKALFVSVGLFLPGMKTIHLFLRGKVRKIWKKNGFKISLRMLFAVVCLLASFEMRSFYF